MIRILILCLAVVSNVYLLATPQSRLWESTPAKEWTEAFPVGNSRMGAMIFGGIDTERLQLNEETFWSGRPYNNNNPSGREHLNEIRNLIFQGKVGDAENLIAQHYMTSQHGMRYLTLGSACFDFKYPAGNVSDYSRELDIDNALSSVSYNIDDVTYHREVIAPIGSDVIIMRLKADKKASLNFTLGYDAPENSVIKVSGNSMTVKIPGMEHEGIEPGLTAICKLNLISDGKIRGNQNSLTISNATEATVYISAATNFVNYHDISGNAEKSVDTVIKHANKVGYDYMKQSHLEKYHKLYDRVKLNLPSSQDSDKLETHKRIASFHNDYDPSLVALLFQYGRYLLISSSQPGGQPANLQGIWNDSMYAPWDSKYTININAEMNYWPAEVTNLSECHEPLFDMIKDLSETGAETARTLYGADGWVAHHNTDLWRICGPVDFAAFGMWPNGGAWLATHLWEHYRYTGDIDFLHKYYPVIKGTADFYLSHLTPHPTEKYLVTAPSMSPEHGYNGSFITAGCTMDNQLAFDALNNTLSAAKLLGEEDGYCDRLKNTINRLAPMRVGRYGQLQEWMEDADDPKDDHRHVSHLYGLYPGNQISPYTTPLAFKGAETSLKQRGDMATGWSIGWKLNLWARLLDGNHADRIIRNMITLLSYDPEKGGDPENGRLYANMFDAHPPFQIDGNFGFTAGVAEMLMQSHDGCVHLLPALPDTWLEGSIKGLKSRGNFEIDMNWQQGQLYEATIKSNIGGTIRIRSYVPLSGDGLTVAKGNCPNELLFSTPIEDAVVSTETKNCYPELKRVYEYDLSTVKGETYLLKRL